MLRWNGAFRRVNALGDMTSIGLNGRQTELHGVSSTGALIVRHFLVVDLSIGFRVKFESKANTRLNGENLSIIWPKQPKVRKFGEVAASIGCFQASLETDERLRQAWPLT